MSGATDVVPVVEDLALSGVERFRPSFVAKRAEVDIAETHAALDGLVTDGELDVHFELICPNDECHRTVETYAAIEDVPLGTTVMCSVCGAKFEVGLSNVWVYYTPSRRLLLRLNKERPKHDQKKKLWTWIKRALVRLAMR